VAGSLHGRDEGCFRDIEMALSFCDLFPCYSGIQWHPFSGDAEVGLNLKQLP
jgi:hypothetical protein